MDAIIKLLNYRKRLKIREISIIVIRIDPNGCLKNSKPCIKCMNFMKKFSNKFRIKIKNVYYSNAEGLIVKEKFNKLFENDSFYTSRGFVRKL